MSIIIIINIQYNIFIYLICFLSYENLKKRKEAGEQLNDQEKAFMSSFGAYRTFGQQVNYNSQAYCLDYSQYAIKYYSSHSVTTTTPVSEKTRELASQVRENKPASIAEMNALAKKLGIKLKMTTDKDYVPTPEEQEQGINVIYIEPAGKDENGVDQVGHAFFIDENGNHCHVESKPNDCFYAVCGAILETQGVQMSDAELREMTAAEIESNGNIEKALESEQWIRDRYPFEANTLLFCAGLLQHNDGTLEAEDQDIIDLKKNIAAANDPNLTRKQKRILARGAGYAKIVKASIDPSPSLLFLKIFVVITRILANSHFFLVEYF